ncbi:hypothetical protein [Emticicia fluvialis]|uniref:hypothetical protein n=1 Tax=Emticicia fluvialis TaxID=2974474 RepID=UPI002165DCFC|nr:hypothetical protein [Emticicia fluvialis]
MTMNKFKLAIQNTPDVTNCYQSGLRALGSYSNKISLQDAPQCEGSIDIDSCTTSKYPNSPRWDYAFGYKGFAYFIEVHSAYTNEVNTVISKLTWLNDWLNNHAPEIKKIRAPTPYFWIQTSGYHILKNSRQERLLAQKGIRPIPKLVLK